MARAQSEPRGGSSGVRWQRGNGVRICPCYKMWTIRECYREEGYEMVPLASVERSILVDG